MTLDDAIKHAEQVAEENQRVVDTRIVFDDVTIDLLFCDDTEVIEEQLAIYQSHADKYRQLAEWLKDYKRLLEQQPSNNDNVSRQAVIKSIGNDIHINFEGQRGLEKYEEDVKLILQCMLDEQIKRVEELPTVVPTQSWIPISEEMPKEGETVLVCYRTQEGVSQSVCEWFDMPNRGIVWSTLCGQKPIAWQPLPIPYEEKRGNKVGWSSLENVREKVGNVEIIDVEKLNGLFPRNKQEQNTEWTSTTKE